MSTLRTTYGRTKNKTLKLRLAVLLAEIDGSKTQLGRQLLATEKDLSAVPPSALGMMCSAALEQEDFSRSEALFDLFTANYPDSPYINSAYQLRAEELFRQEKYVEAGKLATEALELFGAVQDLGWAQVLQGRTLYERKQWSLASEAFQKVFNVQLWRGPLYGEAMFRMAETEFAQGNYDKAFAFYQRTYLLYKYYDEGRWAADAYLRSVDCLKKLGKDELDVKNTYAAMILDEYVRDLPQTDIARDALGPAETARVLATQTNSVDSASTENDL